MKKEEWKNRYGFLLAAIGSSVGLGNIWRFPYLTYDNGGGAFLLLYFFALITAGIPILILEFTIGHKYKGSAPLVFAKINKNLEFIGWWQILISVVISIYYSVVIAWAINYFLFAFNLYWGSDTVNFFLNNFLKISGSPFDLNGVRLNVTLSIICVWFLSYLILNSGIRRGIEFVNKFLMPTLFIIMIIIVIRGIFLPGSSIGLNLLFTPDFSKIFDGSAWVDAYGQVFFSLSVAFAIMITYSSYLPKNADITNNAFITGLMDCGFSILAATAVFSVVGFMAFKSGGVIPENLSGVFLAFATIPEAINQMPYLAALIGVLFFLAIIFAGFTSEISIIETVISAFMDKLHRPRKIITSIYCTIGCMISLIFTTGAGLLILDIVDHFINNFGIVLSGFFEVLLLGWFFNITMLKKHANAVSDIKIGIWWDGFIKYITPLILFMTLCLNFYADIVRPYGGYSINALLYLGWCVVAFLIILAYLLTRLDWYNKDIFKELL